VTDNDRNVVAGGRSGFQGIEVLHQSRPKKQVIQRSVVMVKLPGSTDATAPRRGTLRGSYLLRGVGVLSLLACVATGTGAVEESAKLVREGLRGIFPSTVPAELSADEFAKLDGNWSEWSKGAGEAVADFYAKLETTDADAQRQSLKVLKTKLDVMQRAIDDPRYASLLDPLVALHGRLSQRIDFAEATLDTLEMDPAKIHAAKLTSQAKIVVAAIGELRTYLTGVPNGALWIPYVKADALEKALPAGAGDEANFALARAAKERIAGRTSLAAEDQKEFLGRPAFLHYETVLGGYLAAADWKPASPNDPELKAQLKALSDAADSYSVSQSVQDASKVRAAFSALCKVAPDGGDRIADVLQKHLFNYNVRIVAGEDFLNKLLSDARVERGPVVDNILGANVSGDQTTATRVSVDLRPSPRTARFDLTLNGTIQSSTVGVTNEATVYTQGNHTFVAKKEINFDGVRFITAPGTIVVNPHNTTTGVATNMGGFLFGGIAQNIASQEVEKRRGQAEAIAASRVRDNVLPKFNAEVDKKFAEAGPKLEKDVFSGLRATKLYPDAYAYQTTEAAMRLNSRLMGEGELGADTPQMALTGDKGATLLLHETAVNNSIDRMDLAGQTLTEGELRAKMEEFFTKALGREVKLAAPEKAAAQGGDEEKGPSAIMLAKVDPIRVRFEDNTLTLTIRAGFKQEGKDDIPPREITAPITFEVKGQKILATRGNIRVIAADGEGGGIAINGVVRKKIQEALPEREVDTKVEIKGPNKTVEARISKIKFVNGWAVISLN
jgi:hypothetical protein